MPFLQMELEYIAGSTDSMAEAVRDGKCDGIIDTWPHTEAAATQLRLCPMRLSVRGQALKFGPQVRWPKRDAKS